MNDRSRNRQLATDAPPTPTDAELRAAMDQSEQDVAAALTVPLAEILTELDDVVDQMETRRRTRCA